MRMERRISLGLGLLLALWFQPPLLQPLVVYAVRQAQQPGLALVNTTSPEEARPEARPLPEDGTRNLLRSPQLPWQEVLAR